MSNKKEESKSTNWKSQVKDIFRDMYEVGKPVDTDDIDRFVTELIDEEHIGSEDIRNEMIDYCLELLDNLNDLDMVEESKLTESESAYCYELYDNENNKVDDDYFTDFDTAVQRAKDYLKENPNINYVEIGKLIWYDATLQDQSADAGCFSECDETAQQWTEIATSQLAP